ncbi:MAG: Transposase IS200 like protein [Chloroflexi bacterium OLB14]|nr:MAG: Transposase IS200 like protein [Chloroflexi bacterium OLB14]
MPADLLLVTPSAVYGENLRQALEDTNFYRVHVVNNKASAIVRADEVGVPFAMLDIALGEDWVHEIGVALRTVRPNINLTILCEEQGDPPNFDALRPWIMVRKPFRMKSFMDALSKPQPVSTPIETPEPEISNTQMVMPWLSDPNKAAQHLTRLTLESSAQAALITRKNDLWAYAGGLSQQAAKEVAQTVTRNWDGQKGSDLLRFIRLESTKAEHMLYATRLSTDTVLALVFDAETPFSTIRMQAGQLLNKFSDSTTKQQATPATQSEDDDIEIPQIANIILDVPDPEPASAPNFGLSPEPQPFDPNQTRVGESLSDASIFSRNPLPSKPKNQAIVAEMPKNAQRSETQAQTIFDEVQVTAPSRPQTPVKVSETDSTHESPSTEAKKKLIVEPITSGLYHLTYACLLVPRFTTHHITGDLSERISEWLPNICIAFGWRLEYLAVRPEYLQWVANVQPSTSPSYLMRITRQQTSEKIFAEFPRLKKENPSGDFWAPGYLIMGGTQPHPPQLVRDYINQTRTRQGQDSQPLPRK